MTDPVVEVCGGRRRLGDVQALDQVTFEQGEGTWVGLVGPNGAGKTTLMRVLAGLERLDDGTVSVLGSAPARSLEAAQRIHVGIVPQDLALYGLLTPRENLEVFGRLNGLRGAALAERVDWALSWTGLDARANDRVHTLSGGMKRCLNIACSVLHRPRIVLLDEPTVGVDVAGRDRIWTMLRALRDEGTMLLQSSHQLHELQAVCDRIVILHEGRIVASLKGDALAAAGLGCPRTLRLWLDRDPRPDILGEGLRAEGRLVEGTVTDVSREVARLLARLEAGGYTVQRLRVEAPQLEEVFAQLTEGEETP